MVYRTVPPPYTQAEFNELLADFRDWQDGFTPVGTFTTIPTYIISVDATPDVYASNAYQTIYGGPSDTGGVDGGDPQAVVQAALDDLTSGGSLWFKKGTYDFGTSACNVENSGVALFGEGKATHIIGDNHGNGAFYFYDAGGALEGFVVKNIYFTGDDTDAESHCLYFKNTQQMLVEGCWFEDVGDEPVIFGKSCRYGIVRNNWFLNSGNAGAGEGTPVNIQSQKHLVEGNVIYMSTATAAVHLEAIAGTEDIIDIIVRNNLMYGNNAGTAGVLLNANAYDIKNVLVSGNQIYDFRDGGVIDGVVVGGSNNIYNATVTGNLIQGGADNTDGRGAINFSQQANYNITVTDNIIIDWDAHANARGIVVRADHAVVTGNRIDQVYDAGIQINTDTTGVVSNNEISNFTTRGIHIYGDNLSVIGNKLYNSAGTGIRLSNPADYVTIIGNTFETVTTKLDNAAGGTHNIIRDNLGYVTENGGAATILNGNTEVTVTHGLATTPTFVVVSGRHAEVGDCYSSTWGAATFKIVATAAVTDDRLVYWYAEYKP